MKDPYSVLGLKKGTDPELIKAKYNELKALYSEQRFKAGEEGNEGAKKLQELNEAWTVISADLETISKQTEFGGDYSQIDSLIRQGKYDEAQAQLDAITDRKGEWHYMQSIVFYKREWLTESRTQLEMALQDEPDNQKYRSSLEKLNMVINNPQQQYAASSQTGGAQTGTQNTEQSTPQQQADNVGNCLSSCCCAYCLTDCLCSALRCL